MIPETQRPGFWRSVLITCTVLAVPAMATAAFRGSPAGAFPGALWKLVVFPHAGFMAPGPFPGRPVPVLAQSAAVSIAILQWSFLVLGVAWFSRDRRWPAQVFISMAAVLSLALAVLSLALLAGASIRLD